MILMLSGLFIYSSLTTKMTTATETARNNKTEHLHYTYQHNGQNDQIKCYDDTIYLYTYTTYIKYRKTLWIFGISRYLQWNGIAYQNRSSLFWTVKMVKFSINVYFINFCIGHFSFSPSLTFSSEPPTIWLCEHAENVWFDTFTLIWWVEWWKGAKKIIFESKKLTTLNKKWNLFPISSGRNMWLFFSVFFSFFFSIFHEVFLELSIKFGFACV